MDYSHLEYFCNNLTSKPDIESFTIRYTSGHLDRIVKMVKKEVNIELNNVNCDKSNFLNFHLSEIEDAEHTEKFCVLSTNEKLIKYNVTFEDILKGNTEDINFNEIINTVYHKIADSNPYRESAYSIQLELNDFVISYFRDDIINFIEGKVSTFNLDTIHSSKKIKWIGKPSQLGIIIRQLVEMEYIQAPMRDSGDINYTQFAKMVLTTFDVDTTTDTLIKYLNSDSEKSQSTLRKFNENGFNIPHKNIIS
jgi:hypothetical protein